MGIILIAKPYVRKSDDRLHVLCQAELLLLLLAGYVCNHLLQPDPVMEVILSIILITIFFLFLILVLATTIHVLRKKCMMNNYPRRMKLFCLEKILRCCGCCCPQQRRAYEKYKKEREELSHQELTKDHHEKVSEFIKKEGENEPSYKKLYEGFPFDQPWNDEKRLRIHQNDEVLLSNNPLYNSEQKVFADSNYNEVTGEQTFTNYNPILLPESVKDKKPDKEFDDYDPRTGDGNHQDAYSAPATNPLRRRASNASSTPADKKDDLGRDVLQPDSSDSDSDE